jgi:murein DD-endopeptidase MepM/ murein hydrolase activator NlpD
MRRCRRLTTFGLVALLVVLLAPPAAGETVSEARQRRDALRSKQAAAAAQLNVLKASNADLDRALTTLTTQVIAQEAKVAASRQAVVAAAAELAAAEGRLAETRAKITDLHTDVVARAVTAYMRPGEATFASFRDAADINDASRRHAMLAQVTSRDADVIDLLKAAREDQEIEQARLDEARRVAEERKMAVEARLSELEAAREEKARLALAVKGRVSAYQAEVDALAAEESAIQALIARKEADARARASRSSGSIVGDAGRVSAAGLVWPVRGRVTSEYGWRWGRMHQGIDIAAPTGTAIIAAKRGVVIQAGQMGGYGNVVIIDHGGGFSTVYAHQSRIVARSGQSVEQRQIIGYVGSTGHSTGPHLHFETRVNGSAQNPRRYLP